MSNNPYPVGPGWWHLLDLEIPQLYEIDPDLTSLEIKEKYGACQVDCWPSEAHSSHRDMLADVASAIESQSAIICENCGEFTGVKPAPETPYCERCFNLSTAERFAVRERTKENYFRSTSARHGEPKDAEGMSSKALTLTEVLHLKNEPVIIAHIEKGAWEDHAHPVQSFMDMNHIPLESGVILDLEDFGTIWSAYQDNMRSKEL